MTSEPRILSIIPYQVYPAKLGGEKGIAVFNQYLCRLVHLAGVTIKKNDPAFAEYRLYNIISNRRIRYANIFLYFTIRKMLKKEGATHLLIEHPYYGWLAWLIRKTTNITWVVHSHNMEYMRSKSIGRWWWKALKWYEGWVYRRADRVFFISEDDMAHALKELGADPGKSMPVTYGIEQVAPPSDIEDCRYRVRKRYNINAHTKILLFNGALYHSTNYGALQVILDQINPLLQQQEGFDYVILVCGKGLPDFFNGLKEYADQNIIYAGFVDDISEYFKAAHVFLNPILSGGGVKTKAIEAIALNCTVISTPLGALGLKQTVCGEKLKIVNEGEWKLFARQVVESSETSINTPSGFYEYYAWPNIIYRVVSWLKNDTA